MLFGNGNKATSQSDTQQFISEHKVNITQKNTKYPTMFGTKQHPPPETFPQLHPTRFGTKQHPPPETFPQLHPTRFGTKQHPPPQTLPQLHPIVKLLLHFVISLNA